jgi:hypothetical protein
MNRAINPFRALWRLPPARSIKPEASRAAELASPHHELALLQTLQQKKIAGAAIDVFSVEPLPTDHPFRKLDNIVLTPHLGVTLRWGPPSGRELCLR